MRHRSAIDRHQAQSMLQNHSMLDCSDIIDKARSASRPRVLGTCRLCSAEVYPVCILAGVRVLSDDDIHLRLLRHGEPQRHAHGAAAARRARHLGAGLREVAAAVTSEEPRARSDQHQQRDAIYGPGAAASVTIAHRTLRAHWPGACRSASRLAATTRPVPYVFVMHASSLSSSTTCT